MHSLDCRCALEPNSILRVLRALRGEFFLTSGLALQPASVPCKPELEATTHSKQQGAIVFAEKADTKLIIRILQGALESKLINPECLAIAHRELKRYQSTGKED